MLPGVIKWFNADKGYGLMETVSEGTVLLHINSFRSHPENLQKGMVIAFNRKTDRFTQKGTAIDSRLLEIKDFPLLMQYLGKKDGIDLAANAARPEPLSLKVLGARQIFRDMDDRQLLEALCSYFDHELDENLFIEYAAFAEEFILSLIDRPERTSLINNLFDYFGNNLTSATLFQTWKRQAFRFIGYSEELDYEIPENVLKAYMHYIGPEELDRIKAYSFGESFLVTYKSRNN